MSRVSTLPAAARIVPPGFPRRALWVLLALALILRLGTNLSRVDECFQEGLVRGSLAAAMLHGAPVWPSHAPQIPHIRGSVVMSWISVPFFAVLGPTTFAVRISGILFHLAGLTLMMLLVHRQFGRRASILAGALFVFVPPSLAKIAVLSYGDHIESLPFMFGAALLVLAWIDDRTGRRTGLAFAAGIACGLGISWHAQSRLGIAALALTALLAAPRKLYSRECWAGLVPGALLGLVPHALGDWITASNGLLVQGEGPAGLLKRGVTSLQAQRWFGFWTEDLAASLQYAWRGAAWITLLLVTGCAVGLALAGWRARGREGERSWIARCGWFVIYPAVFSVIFALSRYIVQDERDNAISVRYVLPVVPFLLLAIAVGAARLAEAGRSMAASAVFLPALALGAWGSLSTWDLDSMLHEPARRAGQMEFFSQHFQYGTLDAEEQAELRALEWSLYGAEEQESRVSLYLHKHADPTAVLELITRYESGAEWTWPLRYRLSIPGGALHSAKRAEQIPTRLAAIPELLRPYAGAASAQALGQERNLRMDHAVALLRAGTSPGERRTIHRAFGIGLSLAWPQVQRLFNAGRLAATIASLPGDIDRTEIAFGFGFRVGTALTAFSGPSSIPLTRALSRLPGELHHALAVGLGAGYRLRFIDPPAADLDSPAIAQILALIDPELEAPFRAGLGGSDAAR